VTTLLALDVASRTGWAFGKVGDAPSSGSIAFAQPGSSIAAKSGNALKWSLEFLQDLRPDEIVIEAPIALKKHDNRNILDVVIGLPVAIKGVAFRLGIHKLTEVNAIDVRMFFLGRNPKRDEAKRATIQRCRDLGFDVADDNEADAIAIWFYRSAILDPNVGTNLTALFRKGLRLGSTHLQQSGAC
jgi:hypothetical protein